jgi:hypothetical protein
VLEMLIVLLTVLVLSCAWQERLLLCCALPAAV